MFTGIIEELGKITAVEPLRGGRRLTISCSFSDELDVDESVAVNGACQTIVERGDGAFSVVAVEETLAKTTLGALSEGASVNLERAMRADARLDGHFVQGHVDATGTVESVDELEDSRLVRIQYDPSFASFLIPVGSITVDGISLTVARLDEHVFTVSIIPHTLELTNVRTWRPGTKVNLEFDMIGKYVARWMETRGGSRVEK